MNPGLAQGGFVLGLTVSHSRHARRSIAGTAAGRSPGPTVVLGTAARDVSEYSVRHRAKAAAGNASGCDAGVFDTSSVRESVDESKGGGRDSSSAHRSALSVEEAPKGEPAL